MSLEANKEVVRRFNLQVIQQGDADAFRELMADNFVNHSAPAGAPRGPEGMWHTFEHVLRPALSGLRVEIHDQVAEADRVTTRKTIHGVHTGTLFGIAPTQRTIAIQVIDMVRVEQGRYAEHWGVNTLPLVLAELRKSAPEEVG